jgi:hypothetical protein
MPAVPEALTALVIAGGVGRTVMVSVALPLPPALLALMVELNVPVTLGVPLITPVLVLTLKPVGRPVAPKLVGLLLAVME